MWNKREIREGGAEGGIEKLTSPGNNEKCQTFLRLCLFPTRSHARVWIYENRQV